MLVIGVGKIGTEKFAAVCLQLYLGSSWVTEIMGSVSNGVIINKYIHKAHGQRYQLILIYWLPHMKDDSSWILTRDKLAYQDSDSWLFNRNVLLSRGRRFGTIANDSYRVVLLYEVFNNQHNCVRITFRLPETSCNHLDFAMMNVSNNKGCGQG